MPYIFAGTGGLGCGMEPVWALGIAAVRLRFARSCGGPCRCGAPGHEGCRSPWSAVQARVSTSPTSCGSACRARTGNPDAWPPHLPPVLTGDVEQRLAVDVEVVLGYAHYRAFCLPASVSRFARPNAESRTSSRARWAATTSAVEDLGETRNWSATVNVQGQ